MDKYNQLNFRLLATSSLRSEIDAPVEIPRLEEEELMAAYATYLIEICLSLQNSRIMDSSLK